MPQLTFLGATVRQASIQASFNLGGPSQLTVSLVEDPTQGDSFSPGDALSPVYFSWGSLSFNGLLQRHQETGDSGGYPTYEVVVVDPREILDGTQVVLGGYSGGIGLTPNVINPYGWWEAQGFGLSGSDERGMSWPRVLTALDAICTQPTLSTYGGPLNLRGHVYGLDLSQMPAAPSSYRVGPSLSVSLLELIATVCEDAGYDFLVDLVGTTIRVRTVSRKNSPPIGTIVALADARRGIDLVRYTTGVEGRNEPTSAFLFGGEVRTLHRTTSIASFWGHDASGSPILGSSSRVDLTDDRFRVILEGGVKATDTVLILQDFATDGNSGCSWDEVAAPFEIWTQGEVIGVDELLDAPGTLQGRGRTTFRCTRGKYGTTPLAYAQNRLCFLNWGSALCDRMTLNSSPVEDILGTTSYACTTFEMRLAKAGHNPWSAYLQHYRPDIARLTGMLPPIWNKKGAMRALPQGLVNDRQADAQGMAQAAIQADAQARTYRLYEFVRGYADEYMGRKFAISLPQIEYRQDPETLQVKTSYEIDDGGYLPEGSNPLGLSALNEDVFRTPDGRLRAFAAYTSVLGADFSLVSPDSTVLQDNAFYTAIEVDPNVVYTPSPAAVVTVPGPLFDQATDSTGDITIVRAVLQMQTAQAQLILKAGAWGNVGVRIAPAHRTPASVAVALKSNTETYGPWYYSGAPGKARVEQDGSLVPWLYGGYELMDAAGTARVAEASTSALAVESGMIELAGAPTVSIGDALQAGGSVVTDMQIQSGTQGVTTQYRFQTFTPRFGVFSRGNQDRIKRLALTQTQLRRAVRGVARGRLLAKAQAAAGARVRKEFQGDAPKGMKRQSPHDVLVAQTFVDDLAGDKVRTGVSSLTFEEAVGAVNADDSATYQRTAAMSLNGLLRPFSTQTSSAMASYQSPTPGFSGVLSLDGLNPWKSSNDIEIYLSGDEYPEGMDAFRWGADTTKARPIGLRGPLVIAGFGLDTEGQPVPGDGAGSFSSGYLYHPETWKVGPADLLWDKRRGVWTCHDVMKGVARADIPGALAGSGSVQVYRDGTATDWHVSALNWSSSSVPSGTRCHLLFNALDSRWYAQAALSESTAASGSSSYGSGVYQFGQEFAVVSGSPVTTVEANWASGTMPVGYYGEAGSGELFSRWDHVHPHPIFLAGDLHPEYNLPTGVPYSVLHTTGANERVWERAPSLSGVYLGGAGLGSTGFLTLRTALGSGQTIQPGAADRLWTVVLPENAPASGRVLGVSSVAGDTINTSWQTPAYASGLQATALGIPAWTKITKTAADLSAFSNTNHIELIELPPKTVVQACLIRHRESFAGSGISSYQVSVGVSTNLSKYTNDGGGIAYFNVYQPTGDVFYLGTKLNGYPGMESYTGTASIRLNAQCDFGHTLSQAVSGVVDVSLLLSTVP